MCSEEKMKALDKKCIKCEKCQGESETCRYRGNIIRVICPVCQKDYKPKKKELIDYFRLKIVENGNYDKSSYN